MSIDTSTASVAVEWRLVRVGHAPKCCLRQLHFRDQRAGHGRHDGALRCAGLRAPSASGSATLPMCYGIQFTTPGAGGSAVPLIKQANLAHSASFDSELKGAPLKPGIKHLEQI